MQAITTSWPLNRLRRWSTTIDLPTKPHSKSYGYNRKIGEAIIRKYGLTNPRYRVHCQQDLSAVGRLRSLTVAWTPKGFSCARHPLSKRSRIQEQLARSFLCHPQTFA